MTYQEQFEIAAAHIQSLIDSGIAQQLENANEAQTRLLLVNEILGLLGWAEAEYNPEKATSTGSYTDYMLTIDGNPRLIVEAKRMSIL